MKLKTSVYYFPCIGADKVSWRSARLFALHKITDNRQLACSSTFLNNAEILRVHPMPCKLVHFYVRKSPSQSKQTSNFSLLIWLAGRFAHVEMYEFTRFWVYPYCIRIFTPCILPFALHKFIDTEPLIWRNVKHQTLNFKLLHVFKINDYIYYTMYFVFLTCLSR